MAFGARMRSMLGGSRRKKPRTKSGKRTKMRKVMREFKNGKLKSSSGQKVKSRAQAIAIGLSESGQSKES